MIGPVLLVVAGGIAGGVTGAWPGAVAGVVVGLLVTLGVAGAAAWWASTVGRALEPEVAWEVAPRPPLFRALCDAVYRRALGAAAGKAGDRNP